MDGNFNDVIESKCEKESCRKSVEVLPSSPSDRESFKVGVNETQTNSPKNNSLCDKCGLLFCDKNSMKTCKLCNTNSSVIEEVMSLIKEQFLSFTYIHMFRKSVRLIFPFSILYRMEMMTILSFLKNPSKNATNHVRNLFVGYASILRIVMMT